MGEDLEDGQDANSFRNKEFHETEQLSSQHDKAEGAKADAERRE